MHSQISVREYTVQLKMGEKSQQTLQQRRYTEAK